MQSWQCFIYKYLAEIHYLIFFAYFNFNRWQSCVFMNQEKELPVFFYLLQFENTTLICQTKKEYVWCNILPSNSLRQWFPNCGTHTTSGTRRLSRWYTNRPTTFCLSSQNICFRFCQLIPEFVYFPPFVFKIAIIISHSHYLHVTFVSILVFHAIDLWYLVDWVFLEKGGMWWQHGSHKWYVIRKS